MAMLARAPLQGITGLKLSPYGAAAVLVEMTPEAALVECTVRLTVDAPVQMAFEGDFMPKSASGRVSRCAVASMGRDGLIRYHVGIDFNPPLLASVAPPAAPAVAPDAVVPLIAPGPAGGPAPIRNRW